ncbi:hypothetical protein J3E68DRAFT_405880 [Trichoderma sp. SZMC 28012]
MPCHHLWASLFLSQPFVFVFAFSYVYIYIPCWFDNIPSSSSNSAAQIIIRHLHLQREPDSILLIE